MEENCMNLKRVICVAVTLTLLGSSPCWAAVLNYVDHNTNLDGAFNTDYVNNPQQPIQTINFNNSAGIETNPASSADMLTRVANQIFSSSDPYGYYGTPWNNPGYTSFIARDNTKQNTTYGINTGAQFLSSFGAGTQFFGADVTNNQILMRYSYQGDFNLDGAVDGSDIALMIDGLTHAGNPAYMDYFHGDSNYDQSVDGSDIANLITGLSTQGTEALAYTPPSTVNWPTGGGISPVPEPSTIVLLILACVFGLAARKKF
jgi:hypothetical protein